MTQPYATVVTNTRVMPGHDDEFAAWQSQVSTLVAAFPGYVSSEVIPPYPPTQVDWVIVQSFETKEDLQRWLNSPQRAQFIARIKPVLIGADAINVFQTEDAPERDTATTAVIMTEVAAGSEARFRKWHGKVEAAQSKYPGYLGCELQPPVPGCQEHWASLLRFDSPEHLNDWLGSKERANLVAQSEKFTRQSVIRRASDGFGNWFSFGAQREGLPPAWKNNYIVLLGLYPIVMLELLFLNPFTAWLPLPVGNLIGNLISVGVLGWPVIWLLTKAMAWWLKPPGQASKFNNWSGAIIVLVLIALMGVGFYHLGQAVAIAPVTSL